ncbi:MAG: DUF2167 domain-containing protein [Planctomycetota bacterium]
MIRTFALPLLASQLLAFGSAAPLLQDGRPAFHPLEGKVSVVPRIAEVELPEGWIYLADEEARFFVEKDWGNPPDPDVRGVALPPFGEEGPNWGVVFSYDDCGHVKDSDAASIDYDELLADIKRALIDGNKERQERGYPTIQMNGWAEAPHYDSDQKKLYWAKDMVFVGEESFNTLNYDVRILGREGVLVLSAVADPANLQAVAAGTKELMNGAHFLKGQTYADFDPKTDNLAAYGIGGLIAGKLALKAGLFKVIALFLAKFWKLILIGIAAIGGFIGKLFGRKSEPVARRRTVRTAGGPDFDEPEEIEERELPDADENR